MHKTTSQRIERLDGIRAVAIFLVFLNHVGFLPIGWVGVNLFFVLSGLLITGILRRARTNRAYWSPFYIKRATRILPPLLFVYAATALFYSVPWHKVLLYHLFFLSNVAQTLYFNQSGALGVLWSLSVEEHFYIFWPFAIRYLNRTQLLWFLSSLLLFEPVLRALFSPVFHTHWPIYFLTPFQLDGLAAGSLLAVLIEDPEIRDRIAAWTSKLWLPGILVFLFLSHFPIFQRNSNTLLFNSLGYSIVTFVAVTTISFVLLHEDTFVSRILGSRIFVFFGSISYGFYLFHLIGLLLPKWIAPYIYVHGKYHPARLIPFTLIPITLFSWLSYRFYETPIIRWGRKKAHELELRSKNLPQTSEI